MTLLQKLVWWTTSYSLFKQIDVFLKEKQVTQSTGTYAYLETLWNYGPAAKESQLNCALFYKNSLLLVKWTLPNQRWQMETLVSKQDTNSVEEVKSS